MAWKMIGDSNLHPGDLAVMICYFAFVLFVGLWSSRQNRGSAGGYFLAGRNMNWIPVGASLFASNIGSLHFVGLAGSGAAAGIAIALYEFNAMFVVLGLGYIFLPVYIASGVFTMPEYLKRRFGGKRIQMYLAVLALLVYIFTKISADLYAGALFIEQAIGWDIYPAIMLLLAIAAIFTITGGLTAVLWTDLIQTIIMLIGATVLMVISFERVGGISGLLDKYPLAIANGSSYYNNSNNTTTTTNTAIANDSYYNNTYTTVYNGGNATDSSVEFDNRTWGAYNMSSCGVPRDDYAHLFRDPVTGDLPWPGLTGIVINSIWYWCADQVIVQRSLAGKTYDHSKLGCVLCGYLKLLPFFLLVLPGMVARVLFTDTVGCWDPDVCMEVCGSRTGCSNIAYPMMVLNLLPPGARGMMLAVMMSALMSSLTSIFNSSATIFAMDVWTHIRRRASELEVMVVGRVFVVLLVVVSIIWVPVLKASQGSQLFVYIQEVSSFLQPPICAVFLLALFWPRFNEQGAFVALVIGMAIGLVRFAVQYSYTVPDCTSGLPDPTPSFVKDVHYLYFSAILFCVTLVVAAIVTFITKPVDPRCILRLTWWSRHSKEACWDINEWLRDPETYEAQRATLQKEIPLYNDTASTDVNDLKFIATEKESEQKINFMKENGDGNIDKMGPEGDGKAEKLELDEMEANHVEIEDDGTRTNAGPSCARRIVQWVCGVEGGNKTSFAASHAVQQQDMVSITENPRWKLLSNLLSVGLVILATAMLAIFA